MSSKLGKMVSQVRSSWFLSFSFVAASVLDAVSTRRVTFGNGVEELSVLGRYILTNFSSHNAILLLSVIPLLVLAMYHLDWAWGRKLDFTRNTVIGLTIAKIAAAINNTLIYYNQFPKLQSIIIPLNYFTMITFALYGWRRDNHHRKKMYGSQIMTRLT